MHFARGLAHRLLMLHAKSMESMQGTESPPLLQACEAAAFQERLVRNRGGANFEP